MVNSLVSCARSLGRTATTSPPDSAATTTVPSPLAASFLTSAENVWKPRR